MKRENTTSTSQRIILDLSIGMRVSNGHKPRLRENHCGFDDRVNRTRFSEVLESLSNAGDFCLEYPLREPSAPIQRSLETDMPRYREIELTSLAHPCSQ